MAKLLQVGISYPWELSSGIGHVACTLGGVNYESKGSAGIIKGSQARSAANGLFRHQFHMVLTDAQAARAKRYADAQVGEQYRWGGVPGHGGDCSGYASGIICAALGRPIARLFATSSWPSVHSGLGFHTGAGPRPGETVLAMTSEEDDESMREGQRGAEQIGELQTDLNTYVEQTTPNRRPAWYPLTRDKDYGAKTARAVAWAKRELHYAGEGDIAEPGFVARLAARVWTHALFRHAEERSGMQHRRLSTLEGLHAGGADHMAPTA